MSVYTGKPKPAVILAAQGKWEAEPFLVGDKPTGVTLSKEKWHEVRLTVAGKITTLTIDGKPAGEPFAGPLTKIGFNPGHHGFYLDDFEVVYE